MIARPMANAEWMRHMQIRLRRLRVLFVLAIVAALAAWVLP